MPGDEQTSQDIQQPPSTTPSRELPSTSQPEAPASQSPTGGAVTSSSIADELQKLDNTTTQGMQSTEPSAGFNPFGESTKTSPVAVPAAQPTKKSPIKLILLIALPLLALGLIGGGAFAYTEYQKPENVLLGAVSHAIEAKKAQSVTTVTSDFVYDAGGTKLSLDKLTFRAGFDRSPQYDTNAELALKYNDKQVTLKADVLTTSDQTIYFRVVNLKDTLEKVLPAEMKITAKANEYLAKFDGKWAKYSLEDLKKDNPESEKIAQCTLDVYKKHKDNKKSTEEIVKLYKANPFVTVDGKPKSKDGNIGYDISIDKVKSKAFGKAMLETAIAKDFKACDKTAADATSSVDSTIDSVDTPTSPDDPKTVTTVWISQWGHEFRAIDTVTSNLGGMDGKKYSVTSRTDIDFGKGVATQAPSDTMAMKDWTEAAMGAFNAMTGDMYAGVQSRAQDSSAQANANMVAKKAEAYHVIEGSYPTAVNDFAKHPETKLVDQGIVVAALPTDSQHVAYKKCSGNNGAQVVYRKSDGTYAAINLGSYSGPTAITALCK